MSMVIDTLQILFTRDLTRLKNELEQYPNEPDIWKIKGQINNSAGNLCLHLIGNLNTYIGKELGGSGYVRNREAEFSASNIPRRELIEKIESTMRVIQETLSNFDESLLETEYPVIVFEEKISTGYLLIHLATHLTYHLGQINYHRRLIENE